MSKLLTLLLLLTASLSPQMAHAADCESKTCVEVYVQNGRIVIEARRGKGPTATATSIPLPTAKPTLKPTKKPTPRPTKSAINAGGGRSTKKPSVTRPTKRAKRTQSSAPGTSLTDKLIESIPTAGIAYQPSYSPLINTPVYLWSDVPTVLTKRVKILDEVVDIKLKPLFIWHYGDGVFYTTRDVGAPFPHGKIKHTYAKPGHYLIELVTSWIGEFTIAGVSSPIPSEIVTLSTLPITVVAAPVRFMN
jgi:hypothetical protein